MVEPTGGDLFGLGSLAFALGSFVKGFISDSRAKKAEAQVKQVEVQRAETKLERDRETQELRTRVAVLEAQNREIKERLAEGNSQFKALDDKVDTTNNLLNQIVGALKNSGLKFNGEGM